MRWVWGTKEFWVCESASGMKRFLGYSRCPGAHRNGVEGTWERLGRPEVAAEFREAVWEHTGVPGVPGSMWGAQRRLWRLEGICLGLWRPLG